MDLLPIFTGALLIVALAQTAFVIWLWKMFRNAQRHYDTTMLVLTEELRSTNNAIKELSTSAKRSANLEFEMLQMKQAEMTGDYEIVEEPIVPAPAKTQAAEKSAPTNQPPRNFPKLNIG